MKLKEIQWIDSSIQEHQVGKQFFPKPSPILSVGFLIDETDDYITLARDDMGDGEYRGLICIPKIAIKDKDSFG